MFFVSQQQSSDFGNSNSTKGTSFHQPRSNERSQGLNGSNSSRNDITNSTVEGHNNNNHHRPPQQHHHHQSSFDHRRSLPSKDLSQPDDLHIRCNALDLSLETHIPNFSDNLESILAPPPSPLHDRPLLEPLPQQLQRHTTQRITNNEETDIGDDIERGSTYSSGSGGSSSATTTTTTRPLLHRQLQVESISSDDDQKTSKKGILRGLSTIEENHAELLDDERENNNDNNTTVDDGYNHIKRFTIAMLFLCIGLAMYFCICSALHSEFQYRYPSIPSYAADLAISSYFAASVPQQTIITITNINSNLNQTTYQYYNQVIERQRAFNQTFTHNTKLSDVEFLHGGQSWENFFSAVQLYDQRGVTPRSIYDATIAYAQLSTSKPVTSSSNQKQNAKIKNNNNNIKQDFDAYQKPSFIPAPNSALESWFNPMLSALKDTPGEYHIPIFQAINDIQNQQRVNIIESQHKALLYHISAFYSPEELTEVLLTVSEEENNNNNDVFTFNTSPDALHAAEFLHLRPLPTFAGYTEGYFSPYPVHHLTITHPDLIFPSPPIYVHGGLKDFNIIIQPLPLRHPINPADGKPYPIDHVKDYVADYRYYYIRRMEREISDYSQYSQYKPFTSRINLQAVCFSDYFPTAWLEEHGYIEDPLTGGQKDMGGNAKERWVDLSQHPNYLELRRGWYGFSTATPLKDIPRHPRLPPTPFNVRSIADNSLLLTTWQHRCITPLKLQDPHENENVGEQGHNVFEVKNPEWRLGKTNHLGPQDARQFVDTCSRLMLLTSTFSNTQPYAPEHVNEVVNTQGILPYSYGAVLSDYFTTMPHCQEFYKEYKKRNNNKNIQKQKDNGNVVNNGNSNNDGDDIYETGAVGMKYVSNFEKNWQLLHHGVGTTFSLHSLLLLQKVLTAPQSIGHNVHYNILTNSLSISKRMYDDFFNELKITMKRDDNNNVNKKMDKKQNNSQLVTTTTTTTKAQVTQTRRDYPFIWLPHLPGMRIYYNDARHVEQHGVHIKEQSGGSNNNNPLGLAKISSISQISTTTTKQRQERIDGRLDASLDLIEDNDPLLWVIKNQNNKTLWNMDFQHNRALLKTKPGYTTDLSQLPILSAPKLPKTHANANHFKQCYDVYFDTEILHKNTNNKKKNTNNNKINTPSSSQDATNDDVLNKKPKVPSNFLKRQNGLHAAGLPYLFQTRDGRFVYATLFNDLGDLAPLLIPRRYYTNYVVFFDPISMLVLGFTRLPLTNFLFQHCHFKNAILGALRKCPQLHPDSNFVYLHHWFPNETPMTLTFHNDDDDTDNQHDNKSSKNVPPSNPQHMLNGMSYYLTTAQFFVSLNINDDISMMQEVNVEQLWQKRMRCDQLNFQPSIV